MTKKNGSTPGRKEETTIEKGTELTEHLAAAPYVLMRRFSEEMDRLFGGSPIAQASNFVGGVWSPQVEAFQRENEFVVRADLPGLKKDDVKLELNDDGLTIEGERRDENVQRGKGFYSSERNYGKFYRRIQLPEAANLEEANATFSNGVLEITMPTSKRAPRKPRRLTINEESQPKSKRKAA